MENLQVQHMTYTEQESGETSLPSVSLLRRYKDGHDEQGGLWTRKGALVFAFHNRTWKGYYMR